YEYIGANKFIFALAEEDSAVANLMKDQEFGILVSPSDTTAIRDGLSSTLASFRDGTLKANTSEDFRNHFNRLLLTEELSLLFNRILVKQ
ncbi:MAG: hypothetical protein WBF08_03105, partial [Candidatus Bathyarchaeia archaeon]